MLELGGNLVDVCGIGIFSALRDTQLPRLEIEKGDNNEVEVRLTDDPLDGEPLEVVPPLTVTLAKVGVGHFYGQKS